MPVTQSKAPQVTGISAPQKLGSRAKITDSTHTKLVADAVAAVKAGTPTASSVFVAYYGTPDAKKDKIYLVGVDFSTASVDLERSLNQTARDIQGQPLLVTEMPVQGDLGGEARCGDVQLLDMPSGLCGWAVKNYMVIVLWYNHEAGDLVKELAAIRGAVETKS
ncbi:hypothetical protein Rhe02_12970 [Rhizocola hellebori]|uniref:Uncharacterized protein n=2 Tax=Rhizocola hellebori TaxID=1392758 RepID=A0A8J3Q4S4_9ACTN|nr:hypothetical protein Rhe02_12970 [Rhizocola hellebori]